MGTEKFLSLMNIMKGAGSKLYSVHLPPGGAFFCWIYNDSMSKHDYSVEEVL